MVGGAGATMGGEDAGSTEEAPGGAPDIKVGDHPSMHVVGDD